MNKSELNILLVDADEQNHAALRNLLISIENWQVNLEWVPTYEAALENLERKPPDVCLLNSYVNGHDGLSLLHQMVESGIKTPLILLTDTDDHGLAIKALEAGAVDYLAKDQISNALLERCLRYAVECKHREDTLEARIKERTGELTATVEQLQQQLAECQQTVERLRESERQYRTLFDVDVYSIEVLDAQGNVIDCNTRFQHLLGYHREEVIGRHTAAFASERSAKMLENKLAVLPEQGYVEGEVELARKDGSTLLVWRRTRAIYDDEGKYEGAVAYSRDITERMKAVKQISTLARALEQSPMAMMVTDVAGNIEYTNLEFTELTGYAYEDLVGQNLRTFELGQQSFHDYEALWDVLTAENEWQGELQSLRKDGEAFWESVLITPMFNENGTLTHFIIIREDITERKEAEAEATQSQGRIGDLMTEHISDLTATNEALKREIAERERAEQALRRSRARFKAQYKGIPIPTYSWQKVGQDFVLVDYNNSAEASNNRIAELMGQPAGEIFKDRPQVMADFARCFAEKTLVRREAPYRLIGSGETRYFVTTYNFVSPNLVIVHIQDITEYKQTEEKLAEYRQQVKTLTNKHVAELARIKEEMVREIIRREEVEEALQESEEKVKHVIGNIDERLREQYRSIPIPTYSWQMIAGEFILVDFNDAAAEAMGRIVDFLGKPASEIFQDRPQVLADFTRCYEEKTKVVREAPYELVTTGETRYFVTTYNFVPPNLVIDHIQDITEYKEIETQWLQCREQLETLTAKHTQSVQVDEEALRREIARRKQAEQQRDEAEAKLKRHHNHFEKLIKEQTVELTEVTKRLQRELVKYERATEALRMSRSKLRAQYKGIPIPTYSWQRVGQDFVLVDYNDAAERATRRRIVDFAGKPAQEIFKDRPQVLADFARCYKEKKSLIREAPYKLITTGETRYFVTTYNFVPPNLIICYIKDITEYKQIEEALQIGEEQIELICRFSPEVKLTFVNDAYCWYFNREREALIGQFIPFVVAEDVEKVKQHFASLTQERSIGSIEFRVKKNGGDIRWQRWINRAIFDRRGHPLEIWSVGRDITRDKAVQT